MAALTEELVQRMLSAADQIGQRRVEELLAEARAEAEEEIKSLLKSAMKAALLRQMVNRLEGDGSEPTPLPQPEPAAAEPQASPATTGCYVYAILRADHAMPQDDVLSKIRPVGFEDLQAATADVSSDEFKKGAERGNDLTWIEQKARHHDAVLKALMTGGPIIPLRLGTVLRDEEAVRQVLARHAEPLRANLAALAGKKEWGVKVLMDAEAARALETREQPAATAAAGPAGRAYFARKQREETSRGDVGRLAQSFAKECHEQLSAAAAGAVTLPLGKREAGQPQVVSKAAYLVSNDEAIRFHRVVDHLSNRYESHGLSLQVTGPWPPYNFVRLELSLEAPA